MFCATNLDQANAFKHHRELFNKKATEMTAQYARGTQVCRPKPPVEATSVRGEDNGTENSAADSMTQDTQAAEARSQTNDSALSDDSLSDGMSSDAEEEWDAAGDEDFDAKGDSHPSAKRRRQK